MEQNTLNKEDIKLLLKDLCARLPYGVKVKDNMNKTYQFRIDNSYLGLIDLFYGDNINTPIKPYLRPMSSMTQKEGIEFYELCRDFHENQLFPCYLEDNKGNVEKHLLWYTIKMDLFDWLNAHHFDYRGLIEKGLAIDCTNLNIY